MAIRALMVDVDGVLVDGRPEDGMHWQTSLEQDFAFTSVQLYRRFFKPYWEEIVVGRAALMERLTLALAEIDPKVSPEKFVSYWLRMDSRLCQPLLDGLAPLRSAGIGVYLATNQEHIRAAYLMDTLGLGKHVDGMFYSAQLGAKKPGKEFFTKVQAALGCPAHDILLLDDSEGNVVAARTAGWQAFHWSRATSPAILQELCMRE